MQRILKEKTMDYLYRIQCLYSFMTYKRQGARIEETLLAVPRLSSKHRLRMILICVKEYRSYIQSVFFTQIGKIQVHMF